MNKKQIKNIKKKQNTKKKSVEVAQRYQVLIVLSP